MAHITWNSGAGFVPALAFAALAGRAAEDFCIFHSEEPKWYKDAETITELFATVTYGLFAVLYAAATWEGAYLISAATITPYAIAALILLSVARAYTSCDENQKQLKKWTFTTLAAGTVVLHILSEL